MKHLQVLLLIDQHKQLLSNKHKSERRRHVSTKVLAIQTYHTLFKMSVVLLKHVFQGAVIVCNSWCNQQSVIVHAYMNIRQPTHLTNGSGCDSPQSSCVFSCSTDERCICHRNCLYGFRSHALHTQHIVCVDHFWSRNVLVSVLEEHIVKLTWQLLMELFFVC